MCLLYNIFNFLHFLWSTTSSLHICWLINTMLINNRSKNVYGGAITAQHCLTYMVQYNCTCFVYYILPHHHNRFTALFLGPPGWAGARRELLDFMVHGEIYRGRHNDHLAGRHSIRTNQCPPPPSPHMCTIFYLYFISIVFCTCMYLVTVCAYHTEMKGYLLTYLITWCNTILGSHTGMLKFKCPTQYRNRSLLETCFPANYLHLR